MNDCWCRLTWLGCVSANRDVPLLLRMCQGVEEMELQAGELLFQEGKPLNKVSNDRFINHTTPIV